MAGSMVFALACDFLKMYFTHDRLAQVCIGISIVLVIFFKIIILQLTTLL
jgi:hypothetical protein